MINNTERDEREYLEVIKEKLQLAIRRVDENVRQHAEELRPESSVSCMNISRVWMRRTWLRQVNLSTEWSLPGESASAQKKEADEIRSISLFRSYRLCSKRFSRRTDTISAFYTFMDEDHGRISSTTGGHQYLRCFMILNWERPLIPHLAETCMAILSSSVNTGSGMDRWNTCLKIPSIFRTKYCNRS